MVAQEKYRSMQWKDSPALLTLQFPLCLQRDSHCHLVLAFHARSFWEVCTSRENVATWHECVHIYRWAHVVVKGHFNATATLSQIHGFIVSLFQTWKKVEKVQWILYTHKQIKQLIFHHMYIIKTNYGRAGGVAQAVDHLPSKLKPWVKPQYHQNIFFFKVKKLGTGASHL
jgi:hypothetical protein